jgi:hypothetical protein
MSIQYRDIFFIPLSLTYENLSASILSYLPVPLSSAYRFIDFRYSIYIILSSDVLRLSVSVLVNRPETIYSAKALYVHGCFILGNRFMNIHKAVYSNRYFVVWQQSSP